MKSSLIAVGMHQFTKMRDAKGKKIYYRFPLPMDGMPEYYSPSFDPSTHIAPSANPLKKSSPKGAALEYDLGEVAKCRSRPCHSPEGEPDHPKNTLDMTRLDRRYAMKHFIQALELLSGPRHGELRLRVELRRGLRPWGDFYTCAEYRGKSYKLPQPCKVSFNDRAELHGIWWGTHEAIGAPGEMPLVDKEDWKWWRVCEDMMIARERNQLKRERRLDFAACEAEFEELLATFPWGDDPGQIEARLRAARSAVRNSCASRG